MLPTILHFNSRPGMNLTNVFHRYPAMLHTEMLDYMFERLHIRNKTVMDPFCGTGRSLLCALARGCDVIGVDLNPLACLISRSKLARLDHREVARTYRRLGPSPSTRYAVPLDPRLRFWFSTRTLDQIGTLLGHLMEHLPERGRTKDFFYTALSETVRDCSFTRASEYKLYRMCAADRRRHRPDVWTVFQSKVTRNLSALSMANSILPPKRGEVDVYCDDWLHFDHRKFLGRRRIDHIVTSPPYGDSRTTVAYGEFSKLSLWVLCHDPSFAKTQGLSMDGVQHIDSRCLGGRASQCDTVPLPRIALQQISQISETTIHRANDLRRFLSGYSVALSKAAQVLSKGGLFVLVLGNRSVAGQRVQLDQITAAILKHVGLTKVCSARREVPYKRLPRLVSSTTPGRLTETMTREYVLVYEKSR